MKDLDWELVEVKLKVLELAVESDNHDNPDFILEKAERYLKWITKR